MDGLEPATTEAGDEVERTDREVARIVGSERDTGPVRLLGKISDLADQPPLIAFCGVTIVAGLLSGNPRLARTGLRMLTSHLLATKAKSLIKHRVDRTRPFVMLDGDGYHARQGSSDKPEENSFPSGHTAGAVAVARAIAREYPGSATSVQTAALVAGAIQLPRATHYLSDVLVGAAIGLAAEATVALVLPSNRMS